MSIISIVIAVISAAMLVLTWGTAATAAWAVALCGWLPHCFPGARNGQ